MFIFEAPYPAIQTTSLLPNPQFSDQEGSLDTVTRSWRWMEPVTPTSASKRPPQDAVDVSVDENKAPGNAGVPAVVLASSVRVDRPQ
jgi:hypothetical protein